MTLEEVILHTRGIAKDSYENANRIESNFYIPLSIDTDNLVEDLRKCAEQHEQLANWLECLNEIAHIYIERRGFGEYPTTKEEYADETMKILDKYKIEIIERNNNG